MLSELWDRQFRYVWSPCIEVSLFAVVRISGSSDFEGVNVRISQYLFSQKMDPRTRRCMHPDVSLTDSGTCTPRGLNDISSIL